MVPGVFFRSLAAAGFAFFPAGAGATAASPAAFASSGVRCGAVLWRFVVRHFVRILRICFSSFSIAPATASKRLRLEPAPANE